MEDSQQQKVGRAQEEEQRPLGELACALARHWKCPLELY